MSADAWRVCSNCGGYEDDRETFREDYEIFLEDNRFYMSYRGYCTSCDWSFTVTISATPEQICAAQNGVLQCFCKW